MNNTEGSGFGPDGPATGSMFSSDKIGSFGYGIGISVGILVLITTITLASYFCTRANTSSPPLPRRRGRRHEPAEHAVVDDIEAGLNESTLMSYPRLLYSEAKLRDKATTWSCCSVCLADYKDADVLRLLPDCGHVFHLKCVDPWLRLHPTCPVCRTSPMPSPMPTPLAEVVPLAR